MKGDQLYLQHIRDAIEKIESYVSVGRNAFMAESHWHDATIRQLMIVGEATKSLSPELRSRHPDVPWRRIAGLRDVLVHNYLGVDVRMVWDITQNHIPLLKRSVQAILSDPE